LSELTSKPFSHTAYLGVKARSVDLYPALEDATHGCNLDVLEDAQDLKTCEGCVRVWLITTTAPTSTTSTTAAAAAAAGIAAFSAVAVFIMPVKVTKDCKHHDERWPEIWATREVQEDFLCPIKGMNHPPTTDEYCDYYEIAPSV